MESKKAVPAASAKSILKKKKKPLTAKQKIIKESAEHRQRMQQLQFSWQEEIFSNAQVEPAKLRQAAALLQPQSYDEIVEERAVQDWCGYPLCDRVPLKNTLPKYHISLSRRKVYDQSELASFCSEECMQKSKYFRMQLSEDPVWIRDVQAAPDIHIILMHQNLKQVLAKQKEERSRIKKINTEQIRQHYVQQLLTNVPLTAAGSGKEIEPAAIEIAIVEKTQTDSPAIAAQKLGAHNAIEGYCIDIRKNEKRSDQKTTMVLKPNTITGNTTAAQPQQEVPLDLDDEEAVLEDAMETMMRLKSLKLDQPQAIEQNVPSTSAQQQQQQQQPIRSEPTKKQQKTHQESETEATTTTGGNTPLQKERDAPKANPIKTVGPITPPKRPTPKKKKSLIPEMTLFGKIWTMTDRITTRATRRYLEELNNSGAGVDVRFILHEDPQQAVRYDEHSNLRSQLFSEKILETYALMCSQVGYGDGLRNYLIDLMQTFRFTDPSSAALDNVQAYMMTLVLFKALADSTSSRLPESSDWRPVFDACCQAIGQSTDTIDACVRVLRVAST